MTQWLKNLPAHMRWMLWLWLGVLVLLCWEQLHWWQVREDYLFGFLALPFALYVLHERFPEIRKLLSSQPTCGAIRDPVWLTILSAFVFLVALAMVGLGALIRYAQGHSQPASFLFSLAFPVVVFSSVILFARSGGGHLLALPQRLRLLCLLAFPSLVWILSTPVLSFIENRISLILLRQVVTVVFFLFDSLGLFIEQRGNTLLLPKGPVGVADACSGIRSLMACLFAGSFLGAVYLGTFRKKCIFVGLACALAFVFNIARSLFLTVWAYRHGPESIAGTVHDATGFAVLGLTAVCLLALVPVLEPTQSVQQSAAPSESTGTQDSSDVE